MNGPDPAKPEPAAHKRAVLIWHRRSGKDDVCLHTMAVQSQLVRAVYWYMGPTTTLAREAFWDAITKQTGKRRIHEAFIGPYDPAHGSYGLIQNKNENEMTLDLVNGSRIRFCGSDNYESLLGSPPYGLVFSEYSRADPSAWNFLRPILAENGGWCIFNTTPLGENHAATLYRSAERRQPRWFAQLLPVDKTNVFTKETLQEELEDLMEQNGEDQGRSIYDQEYRVSFNGSLTGSYWGKELEKLAEADEKGISHIGKVPYDPRLPVFTSWDLGYSDATAVWFIQLAGKEIRVIDYLENSNVALNWYVSEIQKKGFTFAQHIFPHDVAVKELGSGRSRVEILRALGINPRIVPAQSIQDGIAAVRSLLPSCWFDAEKCKKGLDAIRQYRRKWDEKRKTYADTPYHDWTSHAADALRYFAMANVRNPITTMVKRRSQGFV